MTRIAGHDFDPITDRCHCGVTWLAIRNVAASDIGMVGIAHTSQLTGTEYAQIAARRAEEDARFDLALREACA